mmetsp:Transcript_45342/g.145391  ORF Transcript_45342/g.145391 Transcript_45342/m.145391 type:complete len:260 (-) Transcript_45342:445-1224(-)
MLRRRGARGGGPAEGARAALQRARPGCCLSPTPLAGSSVRLPHWRPTRTFGRAELIEGLPSGADWQPGGPFPGRSGEPPARRRWHPRRCCRAGGPGGSEEATSLGSAFGSPWSSRAGPRRYAVAGARRRGASERPGRGGRRRGGPLARATGLRRRGAARAGGRRRRGLALGAASASAPWRSVSEVPVLGAPDSAAESLRAAAWPRHTPAPRDRRPTRRRGILLRSAADGAVHGSRGADGLVARRAAWLLACAALGADVA